MGRPFSNYRAIPEAVALDAANDVLALSVEGMTHLHRGYMEGYRRQKPQVLLNGMQEAVNKFGEIVVRAQEWAATVEGSPSISPDQMPLPLAA